jgi:myo-inositol-1(or 4)-monophosphatase
MQTKEKELTSMSRFAIQLARRAGKILYDHYGKVKTIRHKATRLSLVTEVDIQSERFIVREIERRYPHHDILGEELSNTQKNSYYRWIIDPLDGTTNYAHSYPVFCVSIGLEIEKIPRVGVVYDPMRQELFWAQRGKGAFCNNRRIHVSKTPKLQTSLLATGFAYDVGENPDNNIDHFENFLKRSHGVRRDGSAALDLCYVAIGRCDGFWELNLKPWDVAAGGLIVQEAGGKVTNFEGRNDWTSGEKIIASNGKIHKEMMEVLKLSPFVGS